MSNEQHSICFIKIVYFSVSLLVRNFRDCEFKNQFLKIKKVNCRHRDKVRVGGIFGIPPLEIFFFENTLHPLENKKLLNNLG